MQMSFQAKPWVGSLILLTGVTAASVTGGVEESYVEDILTWRAEVQNELVADDGWLTIAGLFWLREGEQRFGSAPDNAIVLPDEAPARVGTFIRQGGKISVRIEPGVQVTMNGKRIESAVLERGPEHALAVGKLELWLHGSGDRPAIRLRDPDSPLRKVFTGLKWFPVDESFRVGARFIAYDEPREIEGVNVFGDVITFTSPGELIFSVGGRELKLQAFGTVNEGFFLIFKDQTSGKETYGAGRFLDTQAPIDGRVELDFNRAYNPPCAYNPYTTCPLPPKQNHLPVSIEAGEKAYKKE